jgi:hypothetical protein
LRELKVKYSTLRFNGGHELNAQVLLQLAEDSGR